MLDGATGHGRLATDALRPAGGLVDDAPTEVCLSAIFDLSADEVVLVGLEAELEGVLAGLDSDVSIGEGIAFEDLPGAVDFGTEPDVTVVCFDEEPAVSSCASYP